jgi:arylsulfatase A-like enzyme
VSEHLLANYDTLATMAEILGVSPGCETDGVSYWSAALGKESAPEHDHIVYASHYGPSLVTRDGWKLRTFLRKERVLDFSTFGGGPDDLRKAAILQLYNLVEDPAEETDLSADEPEKVNRLLGLLLRECDGNLVHGTPQARFAFYNLHGISN